MSEGMEAVWAAADAELERLEAKISRLQEQAGALRQVKSGIEAYLGISTVATDSAGTAVIVANANEEPRGKEAVRRVMAERPGYAWSVPEIKDAVLAKGWIADNKRVLEAVRTNLGRAMESWPDQIAWVSRGRYMYAPATVKSDAPDESGASDRLNEAPQGGDEYASVVSLR